MIQFVQSIWLWAIAGIAVPVIIHLWNVKQGKTLKVGSIAFLTESARAHSKSLRLSELLLLLLRCLLLIVLALLISKPFIEKQVDLTEEKGWVLIERKNVKEAYNNFKPAIDSLLKAGYKLHHFNKGFDEITLEDALKKEYAPIKESNQPYWSLLRELHQQVPAKLPVYLFTDNRLDRFTGIRPALAINLKWSTYRSSDTVSTWLEKAYKMTTDSIRLVIGRSTAHGTSYTYQNISPQIRNPNFEVSTNDGELAVTYKDTSSTNANNTVSVDTSTLSIFIYTDKFGADANYVKAALDAIRDFTRHQIKTAVVNNIESIKGQYDWLFWLSENKLPPSPKKNKTFVYEKGVIQTVSSKFIDRNSSDLVDAPQVYKTFQHTTSEREHEVWKNGYGNVILSRDGNVYRFYSRFNPQWTNLVWNHEFPQTLYTLLYNEKSEANDMPSTDRRVIDEEQIAPLTVSEETLFPKENLLQKIDLTKVFWVAAFVLFFIERMLAHRRKKEEVYE